MMRDPAWLEKMLLSVLAFLILAVVVQIALKYVRWKPATGISWSFLPARLGHRAACHPCQAQKATFR